MTLKKLLGFIHINPAFVHEIGKMFLLNNLEYDGLDDVIYTDIDNEMLDKLKDYHILFFEGRKFAAIDEIPDEYLDLEVARIEISNVRYPSADGYEFITVIRPEFPRS